jgi:molecular chaperone DnaJ
MTRACHVCQGTGKQQQQQQKHGCGHCKGVGHISAESMHDLRIPAGVHSGFTIRLEGLGEQPQDNGETPGDMIVHIVVDDHPKFMRTGDKGRDLVYKQSITFAEAVTGKAFVVPHFAEPLTINTADLGIIVPGKDYLYPGKGMTKTGNLHVIFDIIYPAPGAVLTPEERDTIKEAFAKCPSLSPPKH